MADGDPMVFEVCERGFDGELVIDGSGPGGHVRVNGTRLQDDSNVAKDVAADRDLRTAELVERCLAGDDGGPAALLAHLGVLDPS